MVFRLPLDRFPCCVYITITDVNNLFPDFRSIYYFPLTLRQLRFSGIHYKQSACLLFNRIIRFLLFFVQQKISKRCRLENWAFCIRYFSRTKSAPAKKIQSNVSQVKRSLHAKIRLFFSTFKNSQKITGTFLHAAFQLTCSYPLTGKPLSTYQDLGWLLLLCVRFTRSTTWSCSLLYWDGPRNDWCYCVSKVYCFAWLSKVYCQICNLIHSLCSLQIIVTLHRKTCIIPYPFNRLK